MSTKSKHYSFFLQVSCYQFLAMIMLACLCGASFYLWPSQMFELEFWFKSLLLALVLVFFIWQFVCLSGWQCQFFITPQGEGRFTDGKKFELIHNSIVTPWCVILYFQTESNKAILPIFRDMLSDEDYRHLCRIALRTKKAEPKDSA